MSRLWGRNMEPEQVLLRCPVCETPITRTEKWGGSPASIPCPNCGPYLVGGSALQELKGNRYVEGECRPRISHGLRKGTDLSLTPELLERFSQSPLPGALQQLDNLVIHYAKQGSGASIGVNATNLRAVIGATTEVTAAWAVKELHDTGLTSGVVQPMDSGMVGAVQLTRKGWEKFDQVMRAGSNSHLAFMAMEYGDPELDKVFRDHLQPAAKLAGFDLRRNDEAPEAGLIDNRMRVQIRTSRFVVCDLSHGNNGVYWEAGFAEGIGRPVIYTCQKSFFEDKSGGPHFDTKHHATVVWDPADLGKAAEELKLMIRATLPADAKMED